MSAQCEVVGKKAAAAPISFFERYLKPFVSGSAGQYRLRRVDGRGLPLSEQFLAQMSRAQTIRRSFFAENPNEPLILFKLEPYSLDSSLGRADFRFGNQQMEYRHGPIVQTAFRWPAEADDGRTSLVVEELGGRRVGIEKNTGPWSLFRLIDLMQVDYHSGRDVLMLITYHFSRGERSRDVAPMRGPLFHDAEIDVHDAVDIVRAMSQALSALADQIAAGLQEQYDR